MNILITGAMGFSGKGLYKVLRKENTDNLFISDICPNTSIDYTSCDLVDLTSVCSLLDKVKPDAIFHFAGTFSNEYETDYAINVIATKNLLDAVKGVNKSCRVLLVGSAAEYGVVEEGDNPVQETHPLNPVSIYGLTKVFQTYLMKYYVNNYSMDIVMARPFNIYGKNISEKLFVGKVYQQIKLLRKNQAEKIVIGNLDSERDYITLDDTLSHYIRIMKYGESGEIYNVGNGFPIKTEVILDKILEEENIDKELVESTELESARTHDVQRIYASITKLKGLES
jgi:GDP-4-dehydro-6-deoxy-D-mannose reductase